MNITQAFKSAWKSMISNKLRSFLTMLGMIIGVSSVIILTSLVQGATDFILSTFMNVGTDVMEVDVYSTDTRYVTVDGMNDFIEDNPDLYGEISPVIFTNGLVKKGTETKNYTIVGVAPIIQKMVNAATTSGRFLEYADIKYGTNSCVVGKDISKEFFGGKSPLGETIKINGHSFTVIGTHDSYSDTYIYIPYTSACKMNGNNIVSTFEITLKDTNNVEPAVQKLKSYLYSIMKDKDMYFVNTMKQLLDIVNTIEAILSTALGGIAGISLLVAGIGIMNIMLVTVVERTKEIGIRKSMGAKKKDITRQFVIEAATISGLGGLIGVTFGVLVTNLLSGFIGSVASGALGNVGTFSASPSLSSILLAFCVSTGIGICFGYMPAKKAANLNPIDALRSE